MKNTGAGGRHAAGKCVCVCVQGAVGATATTKNFSGTITIHSMVGWGKGAGDHQCCRGEGGGSGRGKMSQKAEGVSSTRRLWGQGE